MRRWLALLILALAVGGFLLLQLSRPPAPAVEARERSWQIATERAQAGEFQPSLTLYGRIEAPDRIRAAAPVAGRLLELAVRDGQQVEAGEVLARMDPRDLQPRLDEARAELERERVRVRHDREALQQERTLLELAQTRVDRLAKLSTARLGAESAVDQAREDLARARLAVSQREQALAEHPARLSQLEARLTEAARDAERGEIVAPFDARIGTVEVAAGDQVQAGTTLFSLYASEGLMLRARVPVRHVAELRAALARGADLEARVAFGEEQIAARLERIGGEADARGVDALLRLEPGTDLPIGAFVTAELARPAQPDLLSLPFSALHRGGRIYAVEDGRLIGFAAERVGEHRVDDEPRVLVRAPAVVADATLMVTHLPNAIDGLAVEAVAP